MYFSILLKYWIKLLFHYEPQNIIHKIKFLGWMGANPNLEGCLWFY